MGPGYYWVVRSETVQVQALNIPCGDWQPTTHESPVGCTHAVAARMKVRARQAPQASPQLDGQGQGCF